MSISLEEQVEVLTLTSDAQREKINKLLKSIDSLTRERDALLSRVNTLEAQLKSTGVVHMTSLEGENNALE